MDIDSEERAVTNVQWLSVAVSVLAFALITIEERLTTRKTPIALIAGVVLWMLTAAATGDHAHELLDANAEILEIFLFLFAAMVLVEGLDRLQFFDLIREAIQIRATSVRAQFIAITGLAFVLSAVLDNMTATIVMIELARRFFAGRNLLVTAAAIVIVANAGGAWSPIGDVTTIMLWTQAKFTTSEVITHLLLPSIVHAVVGAALLFRGLDPRAGAVENPGGRVQGAMIDRFLIVLMLASFTLPILVRQLFGLSPYLGLLLGLGIVWAIMDHLHHRAVAVEIPDRDDARDVRTLLRQVDHRSLLFFVGILLVVSALATNGVLAHLSDWLFGSDPSNGRTILGAVALGYGSAVVDNVPLTALAIDVLPTTTSWHWTLLAYAVGTGGSHLILGSVAGVIAMGKVEGLTTSVYVRLALIPVSLAFLAGLAVWGVEYWLFG